MASNAQKLQLGKSLNQWATRTISEAIELLGKALPCSVVAVSYPIMTVKFEVNAAPFTLPQLQVPIVGAEYIRYPIQVGCKGVVQPMDVYIGNITGLGPSSAPTLAMPGNLSALVFLPVGNINWSATLDPNAVDIYGPDGAILRNTANTSKVQVNNSGTTITVPIGAALTINTLPVVPGLPGSLWNDGGTVKVS
jgi:hypothetical protein